MNRKVIVTLSGGMDSATLLGSAVKQKAYGGIDSVEAIGFRYGSKHNPFENNAAFKVAEHYKVPFRILDLSTVMAGFKSNLMAGQGPVPEGHYEAESMSQTVVPGRNFIFIAVASGLAWSLGAGEVWIGIHAGDHAIYPDCRPDFFTAANIATRCATEHRVVLKAPFLYNDKEQILRVGRGLDVPYHLTRTCYTDQEIACGKCGSCQERLEAFRKNNAEDPLEYVTRELIPKA